jgi:two-component system chemotaxis response regulator CheY
MQDAYVLIAEDNHDSAQLLRGVLEDMGINRIDVVTDGRAALYALQNCSPPYDLVLCDWDMPEMSGIDVHRNVKSLAKLRDTHFVMVTAISAASRIREAIQQGVSDYLVKPIDIDVLEKKVKAALAGGEPPTEKEELLRVKNKQPEDSGAAHGSSG